MRWGFSAVSTEGLTEAVTVISIRKSDPWCEVFTLRTEAGEEVCAAAPDNMSAKNPRCF